MTPQEAMQVALDKAEDDVGFGVYEAWPTAEELLAALPKGWELVDLPNFGAFILAERAYGARRERERLRAEFAEWTNEYLRRDWVEALLAEPEVER